MFEKIKDKIKEFLHYFDQNIIIEKGSSVNGEIRQTGKSSFIGYDHKIEVDLSKNVKPKNVIGDTNFKKETVFYNKKIVLENGLIIESLDKSYFSIKGEEDNFSILSKHKIMKFQSSSISNDSKIVMNNIKITKN